MNYLTFKKTRVSVCFLVVVALACGAGRITTGQDRQQQSRKKERVLSPTEVKALENLDRIALEARQIENPAIRTDLQALIADALWDFDRPHAKAIFVDAFKNARAIEDSRQAFFVQTQVIKHVWRRDRKLAEELMKDLSDRKDREKVDPKDFGLASDFGMKSSDPVTRQKVELAGELLEIDPTGARDLISRSLERDVSVAAISRLVQLKTHDPTAANLIFTRIVARLSSLPPTAGVLAAIAMADYVAPSCTLCQQSIDQRMAEIYYPQAFQVLQRSVGFAYVPPPVKPELQTRLVQYFGEMQAVLALTLTRFASSSDRAVLQTIFAQQLETMDARKRQFLQTMAQKQSKPDGFEDLSRAVESILNPDERDAALYQTIQMALRNDLDETLAANIEEQIERIQLKEFRDKAWSLLKIQETERLIKHGEFDRARELALKLPDPAIRAKALRTLALAAMKDRSETLNLVELLDASFESVRKAEATIERTQLTLKIVADFIALKHDRRAFDALQYSANTMSELKQNDFSEMNRDAIPNSLFDYSATFGRLGKSDFERTLFIAQSIKWREFRLAAEIVTCRSALSGRS